MDEKRICPSCGSELQPDSKYCPMCGADPNEVPAASPQPAAEEKPADKAALVQDYALRLIRRQRILILIIVLLIAAGIGAGFYIQKTVAYDRAVTAEYESLTEKMSVLQDENAALESENAELAAQIESVGGQLEDLTDENEILAGIESFLDEYGLDYCRFSDYFAEKPIVFVREGETEPLNVTFNHRDELVYWAIEKEDIVEPHWGSDWNEVTCELNVTGLHAGTCMLQFGSSYSEDVFYVLCVVLPAE